MGVRSVALTRPCGGLRVHEGVARIHRVQVADLEGGPPSSKPRHSASSTTPVNDRLVGLREDDISVHGDLLSQRRRGTGKRTSRSNG